MRILIIFYFLFCSIFGYSQSNLIDGFPISEDSEMYSVNNDSTNYVLIQSMTEGQLPSSLIFRNGKEFVLVDFFPDNSLKEIKTAIKKRGELKLHGMHLAYFINGAIRESSSWKNGVRHGITERFNRMGVVVEKYEFRKGKRVTPNIVGLYSE